MNIDSLNITIDSTLFNKLLVALQDNGNNELIDNLNEFKDIAIKKLESKKKIVELNRETLVFKTKNKIKRAIVELQEEGKKINPNSISKKSGVSIVTINKYKELINTNRRIGWLQKMISELKMK